MQLEEGLLPPVLMMKLVLFFLGSADENSVEAKDFHTSSRLTPRTDGHTFDNPPVAIGVPVTVGSGSGSEDGARVGEGVLPPNEPNPSSTTIPPEEDPRRSSRRVLLGGSEYPREGESNNPTAATMRSLFIACSPLISLGWQNWPERAMNLLTERWPTGRPHPPRWSPPPFSALRRKQTSPLPDT